MAQVSRSLTSAVAALLLSACTEETPGDSASGPETSESEASSGDAMPTSSSSSSSSSDSSDSSDPPDSSGSSDGTDDDGSTGGALSFAGDIWPVLTMVRDPPLSGDMASCVGCHGAGGAGGLSLPDPDGAYANLIDTPSTSALCAGSPRVIAGDPDGSCFVIFYEMRLRDGLAWVDATETELVRAWVESGAAP